MQTLQTFEKALKENYLPVWNNLLGIEPSALLGKVKKVPLKGNKIVASAPYGLSGGFGFGAEGQATPKSGNVQFSRFETESKDMYVDVGISAKAVSLTGTSGAMANALDTEVKGAYEAAKWHVGRALFGDGTGKLATITEASTSSNTIKVDDVKFLKEGVIVDIYNDDDAIQTNGKARRIVSVDRINKTITFSGEPATFATGFITVQNSFNREITGLGAIFYDTVETIYGVSKEQNPFLKPVIVSADADISDGVITRALRESKNIKNGNVDTLLCGDLAYDAYIDYLRSNNFRVEEQSYEIAGGFKAIKFVFGNRIVDIVNESFVPESEMWGVDSKALEFHSKDWNFAELQNGGIFNLMENSSVYRALLCNFGELVCTNPGGCVRITDVDYTA